jgi:uncharacterized protein YbaR (Trm112 family)
MQDDHNQRALKALTDWANDLACPACLCPLRFAQADVVCTGCGRIYQIQDAIPALVSSRAAPQSISGTSQPKTP